MSLGVHVLSLKNRWQRGHVPKADRQTVTFERARRVGLLACVRHEEDWQQIRTLAAGLRLPHRQVELLLFLEYLPSDPALFSIPHFSRRDVSLLGEIKTPGVESFVNTPFDYLFCLSLVPSPVFAQLMRRSHARCRVGHFFPDQQQGYELMVETTGHHDLTGLAGTLLRVASEIRNESN